MVSTYHFWNWKLYSIPLFLAFPWFVSFLRESIKFLYSWRSLQNRLHGLPPLCGMVVFSREVTETIDTPIFPYLHICISILFDQYLTALLSTLHYIFKRLKILKGMSNCYQPPCKYSRRCLGNNYGSWSFYLPYQFELNSLAKKFLIN